MTGVLNEEIYLWDGKAIVKVRPKDLEQTKVAEASQERKFARIVYLKGKCNRLWGLFYENASQTKI